MEPRKISDGPFEGMISRVDAAPIQISLVKATKHTVLRLHSHILGGTDDLCPDRQRLDSCGSPHKERTMAQMGKALYMAKTHTTAAVTGCLAVPKMTDWHYLEKPAQPIHGDEVRDSGSPRLRWMSI
jgi:hypothetical protein